MRIRWRVWIAVVMLSLLAIPPVGAQSSGRVAEPAAEIAIPGPSTMQLGMFVAVAVLVLGLASLAVDRSAHG